MQSTAEKVFRLDGQFEAVRSWVRIGRFAMMMRGLSGFGAILLLVCASVGSAKSDLAEKFNLSSKEIGGTLVYYEKSFEPKLGSFEKAYSQFLAEKANINSISSKKEQVVTDINRLLGIEGPPTENQLKLLAVLAGAISIEQPVFYLVREDTTKDYLRGGGKLAGFKYDAATDTATYRLEPRSSDEIALDVNEIAVPISSETEFEKVVDGLFEVLLRAVGSVSSGAAVHEVVEVSIVMHAKAGGPYWRWFTDGFASAVTFEILRRHAGQKETEEFGKPFDITEFKELEKEINLGYWMSGKYCIFLHGGPIEYERRFTQARYAYATDEAQRLMEKHGLECVKEILDEVSKQEPATSQVLLAAIKKVTGEDMTQRLARYQTFATREEGMQKYAAQFNEASKNKDYEQMFINLLRVMELQEYQYSVNSLEGWQNAAWLLYKMDYAEVGDKVMRQCVDLFSSSPFPMGRLAAMEQLCLYVLKSRRFEKGLDIAEEMLETRPEHVPALAVVMLTRLKRGKLGQAKEVAKRIVDLTESDKGKRSLSYKAALGVIGIDPNQPEMGQKPR